MTCQGRLTVTLEDTSRADVVELLQIHETLMRTQTPHSSCHVKSVDDLTGAGTRLFSLREDGRLLAIGALVGIGPGHEELKSMHVRDIARGRGAGKALLEGMLSDARSRGVQRISLETGSGTDHATARSLYTRAGFIPCGPYAGYADDPLSTFMTREI